MDVAPNGGAVHQEVLRLSLVERARGLERFLEVLGACATTVGLRSSHAVGCSHHLLPTALLILVPLMAMVLGRSRVIGVVFTTKVAGSLGLAAEVGLDSLLACGILGGHI